MRPRFDTARRTLLAVVWSLGTGCTAISGIGSLAIGETHEAIDAGRSDVEAGSPPPVEQVDPSEWSHRRPITLRSELASSATDHPVLVVFPPAFTYDRLKSDGSDLRFLAGDTGREGEALPHFVESWEPGKASFVWVLVRSLPTGSSTIQLFYGNANASSGSQFDTVFPRSLRTTGGGGGSFTASDDIDVDWFELRAGDTLTLPDAKPLKITARRIIVTGTIGGDGRGFVGGPDTARLNGEGPGGGVTGNLSGGAGGGYGGAGGDGGKDASEGAPSPGGAAYGSATDLSIDVGSGAGSGNYNVFRRGGAGGGGVSLLAWRTSVAGTISVNGTDGAGDGVLSGGGGSGGGIVAAASFLDLANGRLRARGGRGGDCIDDGDDGGGGGGGGRIKLFSRAAGAFVPAAEVDVGSGRGGAGGGTTAPGKPGAPGSQHVDNASNAVTGVDATLGEEVSLR